MDLQAQKDNGRLEFRELDKTQYQVYLEKFKDGTWFNIRVTRAQKPKTLEQLGYHYAVIIPTVNLELINQGWTMNVMGCEVPIDKDQTDKILKHFCARVDEDDNLCIHDPKDHPNRPIKNKRDMSVLQASQFIDNGIKWSNSILGCSIPEATKESEVKE